MIGEKYLRWILLIGVLFAAYVFFVGFDYDRCVDATGDKGFCNNRAGAFELRQERLNYVADKREHQQRLEEITQEIIAYRLDLDSQLSDNFQSTTINMTQEQYAELFNDSSSFSEAKARNKVRVK